MGEDEIYVKWINTLHKEFCRVIFFINESKWLLERDIYWPGTDIYDIKMDVITKLNITDARKLWKILASKHYFYKSDIVDKDHDV